MWTSRPSVKLLSVVSNIDSGLLAVKLTTVQRDIFPSLGIPHGFDLTVSLSPSQPAPIIAKKDLLVKEVAEPCRIWT